LEEKLGVSSKTPSKKRRQQENCQLCNDGDQKQLATREILDDFQIGTNASQSEQERTPRHARKID
jgi:hypothetical protein